MMATKLTQFSTESLFETLKHIKIGGTTCLYTKERCAELAPIINEINQLKAEKNAVILAHSYVSPDIIHGVADHVGDSYELAKRAKESAADTIVFTAVKFMAETAKILNPDKRVLMPSQFNGCSLADSITGEQVATLRAIHPDHTFVCYINTTADVKANCDVCVTSSNVYKIIEEIPNDKIYFVPDRLMAKNVIRHLEERGIKKDIKYSDGTCYVHETYDADMIHYLKTQYDELEVVSHPECPEDVIAASDYVGSTSQMIKHVVDTDKKRYFLLTECGLSSRLQLEHPKKEFVGSCTMCKYMKSNSLIGIRDTLKSPQPHDIVNVPEDTAKKALDCINAMFSYVG
ncbi:MAG: quinolinate synthase NadA [bacterium]|nr:quinolinate synthase NadA [bacterium]